MPNAWLISWKAGKEPLGTHQLSSHLPASSPGDLGSGEMRPRHCMKYIPQVSLPGLVICHSLPSQEVEAFLCLLSSQACLKHLIPGSCTRISQTGPQGMEELNSGKGQKPAVLSVVAKVTACEAGDSSLFGLGDP
jgi:hypothetical protein